MSSLPPVIGPISVQGTTIYDDDAPTDGSDKKKDKKRARREVPAPSVAPAPAPAPAAAPPAPVRSYVDVARAALDSPTPVPAPVHVPAPAPAPRRSASPAPVPVTRNSDCGRKLPSRFAREKKRKTAPATCGSAALAARQRDDDDEYEPDDSEPELDRSDLGRDAARLAAVEAKEMRDAAHRARRQQRRRSQINNRVPAAKRPRPAVQPVVPAPPVPPVVAAAVPAPVLPALALPAAPADVQPDAPAEAVPAAAAEPVALVTRLSAMPRALLGASAAVFLATIPLDAASSKQSIANDTPKAFIPFGAALRLLMADHASRLGGVWARLNEAFVDADAVLAGSASPVLEFLDTSKLALISLINDIGCADLGSLKPTSAEATAALAALGIKKASRAKYKVTPAQSALNGTVSLLPPAGFVLPMRGRVFNAQCKGVAATLRTFWVRAIPLCLRAVVAERLSRWRGVAASSVPLDVVAPLCAPELEHLRLDRFGGLAYQVYAQLLAAVVTGQFDDVVGVSDVRFEFASALPAPVEPRVRKARLQLQKKAEKRLAKLKALVQEQNIVGRRELLLLDALLYNKPFDYCVALEAMRHGFGICGSLPSMLERLRAATRGVELADLDVNELLHAVQGEALVGDIDICLAPRRATDPAARQQRRAEAVRVFGEALDNLKPHKSWRYEVEERVGVCTQLKFGKVLRGQFILACKVDLSDPDPGSVAALPLAPVLNLRLDAVDGKLLATARAALPGLDLDQTQRLIADHVARRRLVLSREAVVRQSTFAERQSLLYRATKMARRGWCVSVAESLGLGFDAAAAPFDHRLPPVRLQRDGERLIVVGVAAELAESPMTTFFLGTDLFGLRRELDHLRQLVALAVPDAAGAVDVDDGDGDDALRVDAPADFADLDLYGDVEPDDLVAEGRHDDDGEGEAEDEIDKKLRKWTARKRLSILLMLRGERILYARSSLLPNLKVALALLALLQRELRACDPHVASRSVSYRSMLPELRAGADGTVAPRSFVLSGKTFDKLLKLHVRVRVGNELTPLRATDDASAFWNAVDLNGKVEWRRRKAKQLGRVRCVRVLWSSLHYTIEVDKSKARAAPFERPIVGRKLPVSALWGLPEPAATRAALLELRDERPVPPVAVPPLAEGVLPSKPAEVFQTRWCGVVRMFAELRSVVDHHHVGAAAAGRCYYLDQMFGVGEHAISTGNLLNDDLFSPEKHAHDPARAFAAALRALRGELPANTSCVSVDVGAYGFYASISDSDGAFHCVDIDKWVRDFLLCDCVKTPADGLELHGRRELYKSALVRLLARQETAALRVLVCLGRNYTRGMAPIVWDLVRCPGVTVLLIEESGSSKCCSLHLAPLSPVTVNVNKYVCATALEALKEELSEADEAPRAAPKTKAQPVVDNTKYECVNQNGHFTVVPFAGRVVIPEPKVREQRRRRIGFDASEAARAVDLMPLRPPADRFYNGLWAPTPPSSREEVLAFWRWNGGYVRVKFRSLEPEQRNRIQLYRDLAFALGLDVNSALVLEGKFMLTTSRNAKRVQAELNHWSHEGAIEVFHSHERLPGLPKEKVVSELKFDSTANGVDVIKMLRSRQFLQPARKFSITALKRKKNRWLARARCNSCNGMTERCNACSRRRLAETKVVMACAGLGVCDCKKDGPINVEQLDHIRVVPHAVTLWRTKRCKAVEGHHHDVHRDQNATFTFPAMLLIENLYGGRVQAHCHTTTHADQSAAPVIGQHLRGLLDSKNRT